PERRRHEHRGRVDHRSPIDAPPERRACAEEPHALEGFRPRGIGSRGLFFDDREPIRHVPRYYLGVSVLALPRPLDARAAEGTPALDQLFNAHARYIASVVHRIVGDDADLDDIVQETFVEAMKSRLSEVESMRAWLVTIAVRRPAACSAAGAI